MKIFKKNCGHAIKDAMFLISLGFKINSIAASIILGK